MKNRANKTVLVLRTCDKSMTSHKGFRWPKRGPVAAKDWKPKAECGNGLHGLLWGEGNGTLLNWDPDAKWLVVRVLAKDVVDLSGKVKFPRGSVVHCGDRSSATQYLISRAPAGKLVVGGTATAGDGGTAMAGDGGTATAGARGKATAGVMGTATAGYRGKATAGYRGTATAGDLGKATAGDRGTATAGVMGTATAGVRGKATAGYRGKAMAGVMGTATAGDSGTVLVRWWDNTSGRERIATGYVGEDGIEPYTAYGVKDGKLVCGKEI